MPVTLPSSQPKMQTVQQNLRRVAWEDPVAGVHNTSYHRSAKGHTVSPVPGHNLLLRIGLAVELVGK